MKEDARNMNDQPDRFELFTLEEGEEKVTMEFDSRLPNTAIFTFAREDHTLGNLLQSALLETEHVLFAAYKVPHPLFPTFQLRVQTDSTEVGPREALDTACKRVIEDLSNLSKQFTREWELCKLAAGKEGRGMEMDREQWNGGVERDKERAKNMQREREKQNVRERDREREREEKNMGEERRRQRDVDIERERNKGKERAPWEIDTPPEGGRAPWEIKTPPRVQREEKAPWEIDSPTGGEIAPWEKSPSAPPKSGRAPLEGGPLASSRGERIPWKSELSPPPRRERAPWDEGPSTASGIEKAPWEVDSPPRVEKAPWELDSPPVVERAAWEDGLD